MISIIVPVRYQPKLTQVCIDSILNYTDDFELIVVQEGEDEEITNLLKRYGSIKVVHNKEPKGYAGALNAGMRIAQGDYYCFMNNDTVVTPDWMKEMLEAFKDKEVGLSTPTFWGMGSRQSVDWNERLNVRFDWVLDEFALVGVCFLVPKKVMEEIGEWDEDFFHGGEDFDITLRIRNAGYKMIVARESFIYHYGGASTRELFGHDIVKVKSNARDRILQLIKKHNLDEKETFERLMAK